MPERRLFGRPFVTLLAVGALNSTGRWLDMLVIAIFVLDASGSPFIVASMLMLRLLPLSLFGLLGGVIAHRLERWRLLLFNYTAIAAGTVVMYVLSAADELQVWHCGLFSFATGLVWSLDFPVRRTLMGELAGAASISRAMSLDILAGSATRMLGPLLGGYLYQEVGVQGAFLLSAVLYAAGVFMVLANRPQQVRHQPVTEPVMENLRAGWHALRKHQVLLPILAITVVFNLWGFPFVSMVPVFGKEVLGLSDALTGVLTSAEGAGALLGAVALSLLVRSEHSRYLYVCAVGCYCAMALAFSFTSQFALSAALLLLVGLVSAAFGSMQSALVLMNAPPGFDRQMMGVLSVCIGTAPLGFLHIGLLADWLGAPLACAITAAEGLTALFCVLWIWPGVFSRQPSVMEPEPRTAAGTANPGEEN